MDRRDVILKYITKEKSGIEIGPYFTPLTPKREGYNCLTMDVFDSAALRELAAKDLTFTAEQRSAIEDVDLVGSSTHIDEVVSRYAELGSFDYIVSSHNFEHLPNPIRFLQGCAKVLKPGGIISLAMPDRRACYDYFRPVTRLSDWLEAWLEDRSQPTLAQVFDNTWVRSSYDHHGVPFGSFFRGAPPNAVTAATSLEKDFEQWVKLRKAARRDYQDVHCSVFTPSSFELLIRDAAYLGLISFEIVEISESPGVDFFAHLRAVGSTAALRPSNFEQIRNALVHRMLDEASETSTQAYDARTKPVETIQQRLDELAQAVARNNDKPEPYRPEFEAFNNRLDGIEAAVVLRDAEREAHRLELAAANEKIHQLNETVSAYRASTSWKITAPLRRAVTALRGRPAAH